MPKDLNKIKEYAIKHRVPIIFDEGLLVLYEYINKYNNPYILEIGSAIGYSAIAFAKKGAIVHTIEKDEKMYLIAKENITNNNLNNKITIYHKDALDEVKFKNKFDIIFIDAAKAQYINFFNIYEKYLKDDGVIISDNLNFHNLDLNLVSRSTKQLLRKIKNFKVFLKENEKYHTIFINKGDGISVSRKK